MPAQPTRLGPTVLGAHSRARAAAYTMPDVNIVVAVVDEQARRIVAGKERLDPVAACFSAGTGTAPGDPLLEDFGAALDDATLLLAALTLDTAYRALTTKGYPEAFGNSCLDELEDLTRAAGHYYDDLTWDATQVGAVAVQHLWAARCPTLAAPPAGALSPHTHPDSRLAPADHEDAHQAAALAFLLDRTGADIGYATADLSFCGALTHLDIGPVPPTFYGELREHGLRTHGYLVPVGSVAEWRPTPGVAPAPARPAVTGTQIVSLRRAFLHGRRRGGATRGR